MRTSLVHAAVLSILVTSLAIPAGRAQDGSGAPTAKSSSDEAPVADPARPTVTNPAHIPPAGYLQFEQGFVQANGSPGLTAQFSVVNTTKLSLDRFLMVQVGSQPFAHTSFPSSPASSDTGDLVLGGQVLFTHADEEGRSHKPTTALAFNRRVRAGSSADLDIGSFSQGATLLVSGDFADFHYDTNFLVNEQTDGSVRRAQYGQTIAISHTAGRNISIAGELWHFTQPLVFSDRDGKPSPRSNAVGTLYNIGYTVRPTLVLDAGFEHGLTSTSTAWQGFAGFTYLLPHRLWPAHVR